MRKVVFILLFYVYPEIAWATSTSDAVNERIPVRNDEMEIHWQVDCQATWLQLRSMVESQASCQAEPGLLRDLQLCSFIYQPPGEESSEQSPDYSGALDALHDNQCPDIP